MNLSPRDGLYASIATGTWPDISPYTRLPLVDSFFNPRLYPHQLVPLSRVAALMRAGYRRVLLQAPTGFGKTVCAESVVLSALASECRAQFLVHRKELIKQTSRTFTSAAIGHSFVASDFPFDQGARLHLSGVQTLVRRIQRVLPPDLVIVDECHHSTSATYAQILEQWPNAFILGLTATPERLDGRGLEEQFDEMVEGPSVAWLIENGFLSRYDYYAPEIPDLGGIDPDRNRSGAAEILNKPKLIGDIVEHYLELAAGEQGLIFAQNRAHSRAIVDAFKAHQIPAMHVDGDSSRDERDYFDDAFRAGDIRVASNVSICGEGYDVPNISYLGVASATRSLVNHAQWNGRVLRRAEGKLRAVICDHAGNALPVHLGGRGLGLPDEDRAWSLLGNAARRKIAEKDWTAITQCMDCFRVYPSASPCCPGCASERPMQPRIIRQEEGRLTKVEREALRAANTARRKDEEAACTTYEEMVSLGRARGYDFAKAWAKRQCRFRRIAIPYNGASIETVSDEDWEG